MEDKINDIIKLFDSIECPAIVILKTKRVGESVDNDHGVDFDLPEYAVIYKGYYIEKNDAIHSIYDWEQKNNCNLFKFSIEGCDNKNPEGLIQEMNERDGYEVIYRKEKIC